MKNICPIITIDGPSGAGKGTLSCRIAKKLKWNFLDSGAIYRVIGLEMQYKNLDFTSKEAVKLLYENLDINFLFNEGKTKVLLRGEDVSKKIQKPCVSNIASQIATFFSIRKACRLYYNRFIKLPGLVADGRDMGTIVFPDAPVKIFLYASPEKRAYRRMLQLKNNGFSVNFDDILSQIVLRDNRDRNRSLAPLVPAKDALILDSTELGIDQVMEIILKHVKKKIRFC